MELVIHRKFLGLDPELEVVAEAERRRSKTHASKILSRLGVHSRTQAEHTAVRLELVQPEKVSEGR